MWRPPRCSQRCMRDQGEMERAINIAEESLEQHADRAASYLLLARLYAQADKHDRVVKVLSDLIRTKPDDLQKPAAPCDISAKAGGERKGCGSPAAGDCGSA